jgi:hypothetical protein
MTTERNTEYPYPKRETLEDQVTKWVKDHPVAVAVTTVLLVKNHNLKKRNAELRKQLRVASEAVRLASEFIVATDRQVMFKEFLDRGTRR